MIMVTVTAIRPLSYEVLKCWHSWQMENWRYNRESFVSNFSFG